MISFYYISYMYFLMLILVFFLSWLSYTWLGEEKANLSAFRTFVRIALVFVFFFLFCFFLTVSSSSWCLGRAVASNCDNPWIFLLPFFVLVRKKKKKKKKRCTLHKNKNRILNKKLNK